MNQSCFIQKTETIEKLLCKDSDECGAKASKLILLDQLVQINTQQFEDQAEMLSMDEGVF